MKRKRPLWHRSCIDRLNYDTMREELSEMCEIEYEYSNSERREEFEIFFSDVGGRAQNLAEEFYNYRGWFDDDLCDWNDLCVVLLGAKFRVWGYDSEEMDYFSLFQDGIDMSNWAIEKAQKRIERLTKCEIIKQFQKVMLLIVTYYDIKSAYDALAGALDFLENDGLKKSEELTQNFERLYRNLRYYNGEVVRDENSRAFDREVETFPQRWWVE